MTNFTEYPKDTIEIGTITGAPKLINSDLFLEKRATVPRYCSTFFQKQVTINKFWGTCGTIPSPDVSTIWITIEMF